MLQEEKVQFFNSESSFGSESSMASSRYFDLTNQMADQTETILMTLQREVLPTEQLTNLQKIQYLINRAHILAHDSLPSHIQYLEKISAPKEAKQSCRRSLQRLRKLLADYQSLSNSVMTHKQFYNIYGRANDQNKFFKRQAPGEGGAEFLQAQVVEFIHQPGQSRVKDYKVSARGAYTSHKSNNAERQREYKDLHEELQNLKKRQYEQRKQFEMTLSKQKANAELRIQTILTMMNSNVSGHDLNSQNTLKTYKNELSVCQASLQASIKDYHNLVEEQKGLQQKYLHIQKVNESLNEQLNSYRKIQNSRMEDFDNWASKSFQSQNQNQSGNKNDYRNLNQTIKKLMSERDLLRSQLAKQREQSYSQKASSEQEQSKQLRSTRLTLEQRNKQVQSMQRQSDKARVELIQLKQENKQLRKQLFSTKENNDSLRLKVGENSIVSTNHLDFNSVGSNKNISLVRSKVGGGQDHLKIQHFGEYQGEGIEGYPYYELLQKEFRIRFRRACLKSKELLHKSNGLEVGVLTNFIEPNIIRIMVHITNYSEEKITHLKVKPMNPNDNKLEFEAEEVPILVPNQQLKLPLACTLRNYPVGPVVLAIDYSDAHGKHDLRLLLPVHIFKCVQIQPRSQKMMKPITISLKTDRKIVKDAEQLRQYFNCQGQQQIRVKVHHEHSKSLLFLDVGMGKEHLDLSYEHVEGRSNFTEYFIKTLKSLLEKPQ